VNGAAMIGDKAALAKVVTDHVTFGVEQLGMKATASHTRRPGPAGR